MTVRAEAPPLDIHAARRQREQEQSAWDPGPDWQTVPEGAICAGGLQFEIDPNTGLKRARRPPEDGQKKPAGASKPNGENKAKDRLRLVPPSEMDWRGAQLNLVKGILGHGMMALLYGESGSSKTLIALDLALHVARGRDWCERKVKQGFVVYLAPEGGHSVHLRFHAWCLHHGVGPTDDRLPFRTIPVRVDLCKSGSDVTEIIERIRGVEATLGRCVMVVVDTVSRALAGGNENAPDDMGNFVAHCDQLRETTGATVLAVHHKPKEGSTPRGHSSLMNGCDIRLDATKVADGLFSLEVAHLKDAAAGSELLFKLQTVTVGTGDDGQPATGGLVVFSEIKPAGVGGKVKGGGLTSRQLRVMQELRGHAARTRQWTFTHDEFQQICTGSGAVDATKTSNIVRARVSELKVQLANRKLIHLTDAEVRLAGTA